MKIYKIELDMTYVLARLKKFKLDQYNGQHPIIFVEGENPDDACHVAMYQLAEILLRQDASIENAKFIKDILYDILVIKIESPK